jgi:FtsH-binding integral membrane protein
MVVEKSLTLVRLILIAATDCYVRVASVDWVVALVVALVVAVSLVNIARMTLNVVKMTLSFWYALPENAVHSPTALIDAPAEVTFALVTLTAVEVALVGV